MVRLSHLRQKQTAWLSIAGTLYITTCGRLLHDYIITLDYFVATCQKLQKLLQDALQPLRITFYFPVQD